MPRSAPPDITIAKLSTFAHAAVEGVHYLNNEAVEQEIAALLDGDGKRVKRVERGTSPKGLPITELVIEDPIPEPKQHIVWHLDPHAADEREPLIAGFHYARLLLDHPELLRGRSLHLYISSPDDRTRIASLYRRFPNKNKLGVTLRNRDVRTQAGWTSEPLSGPFTELSSPGWRGLDAVISDVIARVKRESGSSFCLFVSGHSAAAADGTNWRVGARTHSKRRFIGIQLERTARVLMSGIFSKGSCDAWYLRRLRGTRATYPADTREARADAGVGDIGSTDADLALHRDREAFGDKRRSGHLVTLNSEVPQLDLVETLKRNEMTEDQLRVEIKGIRKLNADGYRNMAKAGEIASRILQHFSGLEGSEHLDTLAFYGKQRENRSFQTGDAFVDLESHIVDVVTGSIIMLKDLAIAGSILKSVVPEMSGVSESDVPAVVDEHAELISALRREAMLLATEIGRQYGTIKKKVDELYEVNNGDLPHQVVLHMAYVETAFAASFNLHMANDFDIEAELELG